MKNTSFFIPFEFRRVLNVPGEREREREGEVEREFPAMTPPATLAATFRSTSRHVDRPESNPGSSQNASGAALCRHSLVLAAFSCFFYLLLVNTCVSCFGSKCRLYSNVTFVHCVRNYGSHAVKLNKEQKTIVMFSESQGPAPRSPLSSRHRHSDVRTKGSYPAPCLMNAAELY